MTKNINQPALDDLLRRLSCISVLSAACMLSLPAGQCADQEGSGDSSPPSKFALPKPAEPEQTENADKPEKPEQPENTDKPEKSENPARKAAPRERTNSDEMADEPPLDVKEADPELHLKKAKELTKEKKYNDALLEVNKALKLNKTYWEARYQGAFIYQLQGRSDAAIKKYRQVLDVKPDHLEALINLGILLRKQGNLDQAIEEYRKAIEVNFYSLQAHYNLANVLVDKDDLDGALKELRICEKQAPNNAWVHNNLGVIFQRREYYEEAEEEFLRALNLEPANKTFVDNLSSVRFCLKKKPVKA